jgi:hypothetical protein
MKTIDINKLKTIKNFARENDVTSSYIYKLIKENRMKAVIIDDVKFIDLSIYPKLHSK